MTRPSLPLLFLYLLCAIVILSPVSAADLFGPGFGDSCARNPKTTINAMIGAAMALACAAAVYAESRRDDARQAPL
jgi:hypothetical protein